MVSDKLWWTVFVKSWNVVGSHDRMVMAIDISEKAANQKVSGCKKYFVNQDESIMIARKLGFLYKK